MGSRSTNNTQTILDIVKVSNFFEPGSIRRIEPGEIEHGLIKSSFSMLFKEKFARGEDSTCKMGVIILSHAANDDEGSLIPTDRKHMLLQTD